ncbi:MipA/OmpV family protein [Hydrogenophaga sp.]|uniref:MipA/OmpV family protein n=1 Tax=Hydrogenophaga sp. TaxID=1904254 RepID=UPI003D0C1FFC
MAGLLGLACACAGAAEQTASAPDPVALDASRDYLLGASLVSSAPLLGSDVEQRLRLRPIWAFRLGRFRFATSGASALLSQGRKPVDSGVSTVLAGGDVWSLSTSLSIDEGRSWDDDARFRGLPDIRATVHGRLAATAALSSRWTYSVRASQDLLGRQGGLRLDHGLGYRYPVSSQTHWDLSLGAGWANGTHHRTHYGIAAADALATGLPAYAIGSGWDSVSLGWRITSALSRHWVAFGGVSATQLRGAAARSPLVGRKTAYGATVGLAYRNH